MPTREPSARTSVLFVLHFLLLALFLILSASLQTASASLPFSAPSTKALLSTSYDANCWQVVPSPNPPSYSSQLNSISADGPNGLWAVGSSIVATSSFTLIEHWDGTSWSIIPS